MDIETQLLEIENSLRHLKVLVDLDVPCYVAVSDIETELIAVGLKEYAKLLKAGEYFGGYQFMLVITKILEDIEILKENPDLVTDPVERAIAREFWPPIGDLDDLEEIEEEE